MRITLDSGNPEHLSLARLILARRDINQALKVGTLIVERISSEKDELFEPLSCAAVIWYARPFVKSRGHRRFPGGYETGFPSPAQKKIHDGLIEHRNRFEAHADKDFHEVTLVHKGTTIEFADGARFAWGVHRLQIRKIAALPIDFGAFQFPASKAGGSRE
jgi:hypothetical protein